MKISPQKVLLLLYLIYVLLTCTCICIEGQMQLLSSIFCFMRLSRICDYIVRP